MSVGISFTLCSFFFILLLTIVYFSKRRLNTVENNLYAKLILTSLFGTSIGVPCYYFMSDYNKFPFLNMLTSKGYMIYLVFWITIFTCYIFIISYKNIEIKQKKILLFFKTFAILFSIIVCVLPLYYFSSDKLVYSYGPSANFMYLTSGIYIVIILICMFRNIKKLTQKKFLPLILFIIIGTIIMIIQKINPGLLLITFGEAFITFLMYFTIENPDMQIMEELYKNKKLVEKSNQDTSNFLFRMTQEIKKPVKDIIEISQKMSEYNDINELKQGIKYINNTGTELDYLINDALDVSSMTTKKLKIYDSRYNPINVFKEIQYRFEKQIEKNIKFNFSISNVIPSYLYGDSIKLKQAVNSILMNALNYTSEGEINLDVSGIVKYGVCRLIITISDTGKGMSIEEVNNILSLNSEELSSIDLRNRDGEILNLKEVKKLVSLLGGNLMVKSEEKIGTTVNIVLEQKIVESKETEISKKLESYEQSLYHNKRVMVVDDDAKELAKITSWLEEHNAEVSGSLFGRDAIEKIAFNIKYDLILLDDETSTYSALDVLKELKKNKKFNIPVVVMIDDNKEFIKLHYLQDGFADCIMKSKLESEINRIMKRF